MSSEYSSYLPLRRRHKKDAIELNRCKSSHISAILRLKKNIKNDQIFLLFLFKLSFFYMVKIILLYGNEQMNSTNVITSTD